MWTHICVRRPIPVNTILMCSKIQNRILLWLWRHLPLVSCLALAQTFYVECGEHSETSDSMGIPTWHSINVNAISTNPVLQWPRHFFFTVITQPRRWCSSRRTRTVIFYTHHTGFCPPIPASILLGDPHHVCIPTNRSLSLIPLEGIQF